MRSNATTSWVPSPATAPRGPPEMRSQMRGWQGRRSRKSDSVVGDDIDDDFSSRVSLAEIPERFCCLTQLVPLVDDRSDRSGFEKLLQDDQIRLVDLRQERSHHPAA